MITVRMFDFTKDMGWLADWHRANGDIPPVVCQLPSVGSVVEKDGIPVAVGFLYLASDCPMSVIEWVSGNPESDSLDKLMAVSHVLKSLKAAAIAEQHPIIHLYSNDCIARVARGQGFNIINRDMYLSACLPDGGN